MSYKSIDELQTLLSDDVFASRRDSKKAAGRALGTFIETIVFYVLRQWGELNSVAIERPLAEYGRSEITHNVEFTLHPIVQIHNSMIVPMASSVTSKRIANHISLSDSYQLSPNNVLKKNVLQNACLIGTDDNNIVIANLGNYTPEGSVKVLPITLNKHAYAMIECKRVGKEGDAKGPQTIEKAKQGAYVARTTSSLQKVRNDSGGMDGVFYVNGAPQIGPYEQMLEQIIEGDDSHKLRNFTLSIGVVSNHGNWFTMDNQNKELKVLSQSYDWLLFLTDEGLSKFITDLLIKPDRIYVPIKEAFINSYCLDRTINVFTKKTMTLDAHYALDHYFAKNIKDIEGWFNVISPCCGTMSDLRNILETLKNKDWRAIL